MKEEYEEKKKEEDNVVFLELVFKRKN